MSKRKERMEEIRFCNMTICPHWQYYLCFFVIALRIKLRHNFCAVSHCTFGYIDVHMRVEVCAEGSGVCVLIW
jgi:hypothetical protein